MTILVDTDWIINGLGGRDDATRRLVDLGPQGLAVSAVTIGELFEGAYRRPNSETVMASYRTILEGYRVLPVTEEIAVLFARVRSELRAQGNLIPDLDLLIAATAIAHDLTLLTRNRRYFERVPGLALYADGQRSLGTTPSA